MIGKGYRVVYAPSAEHDLRELWRYIAQFNVVAADKLYDTIKSRTATLKYFPNRGRYRDDLQEGLRMNVVGSHVIFYRVEGNVVRVVRVLHGARNLANVFK